MRLKIETMRNSLMGKNLPVCLPREAVVDFINLRIEIVDEIFAVDVYEILREYSFGKRKNRNFRYVQSIDLEQLLRNVSKNI